jgi:hypothetical protein
MISSITELRALPLFGELSEDVLQLLSAQVQTRVLPAGTTRSCSS